MFEHPYAKNLGYMYSPNIMVRLYSYLCFVADDLHRAWHSVGSLEKLASDRETDNHILWKTIEFNAKYILKCILSALAHLESMKVIHGDLKG